MAESKQHTLDRIRSPRVQITYDVEIGDAIEKKELPFVVGVLADLSGNPENPLCWTTKSVRNLANELEKVGIKIHYTSIGNILEEMGFSLQQNKKYVESGTQSIDRDEQFKFINSKSTESLN